MKKCQRIIDLSDPKKSYKSGRGRHAVTVFVYACPACGNERRILASTFQGGHAVPAHGGIICGRLS